MSATVAVVPAVTGVALSKPPWLAYHSMPHCEAEVISPQQPASMRYGPGFEKVAVYVPY